MIINHSSGCAPTTHIAFAGNPNPPKKPLQEMGRLPFSLDEIAEFLTPQDGTHCNEARVLGEQKLTSVRQKIRSLQGIEKALNGLVQACSAQRMNVECPLIASLQHGVVQYSEPETSGRSNRA